MADQRDESITATVRVTAEAMARIDAEAERRGVTSEALIKDRLARELSKRMMAFAEEWFGV